MQVDFEELFNGVRKIKSMLEILENWKPEETPRGFQLLTVAETAERLGVSEHSVRKLLRTGQLPPVRVFTSLRVDSRDLDALVDRLKQGATH